MTHLLLPVASALLSTFHAPAGPDSAPERREDLPVLFLLFCVACAAMTAHEALRPAMTSLILPIETVIVPQL